MDPFATVANNYDIMIDWPARLARERPFFEQLIGERPASRVLDVGCGTGHHSRLFAELGLEVIGLDPSEAMLARARELTLGENPRFVLGGFTDIPTLPGVFDLVVVLGNTLAYAKNAADLAVILRRIGSVIAPGGRLCLQVVNFDSLPVGESRWLPLIHRESDGRDYLFLREYRRVGRQVEFTIISLIKNGEWNRMVERSMHFPLTGQEVAKALRRVGFGNVQLFGDYQRAPYESDKSPSLVVLAEMGV